MIADAAQRYRRTGSGRAVSYSDYLEAEIACAAGQPRRALAALERAQLAGNLQSGRIYAAEFQRLRALATFECHAGRDAAEAGSAGRSDFGAGVGPREAADTLLAAAHELATAQGAKAFADRAALARANLNRRRRKPHLRFAVTSDR